MKIEDLKVGDVLVSIKHKEEHAIIFTTSDDRVGIRYALVDWDTFVVINQEQLDAFTLKPKDGYIQGFKVGKYNGEIVEVRNYNDNSSWVIDRLLKINNRAHPFTCKKNNWKYARPIPQDKREFLEI